MYVHEHVLANECTNSSNKAIDVAKRIRVEHQLCNTYGTYWHEKLDRYHNYKSATEFNTCTVHAYDVLVYYKHRYTCTTWGCYCSCAWFSAHPFSYVGLEFTLVRVTELHRHEYHGGMYRNLIHMHACIYMCNFWYYILYFTWRNILASCYSITCI